MYNIFFLQKRFSKDANCNYYFSHARLATIGDFSLCNGSVMRLNLILGERMVTVKTLKMRAERISENIDTTARICMVPSLKNRNSTETLKCLYLYPSSQIKN